MNPAQQKAHTTRSDELERMIVDLGTVVYAKVNAVGQHADAAVNGERTQRLRLAEESRTYVNREMKGLERRIEFLESQLSQFKRRTLWYRFRWLFRGETV